MSDKKEQSAPAQAKRFAERLSAALDDIGMVGKDGRNDFHRYDYTSAAAVQRAVQKALSKHGLFLSSTTEIVGTADYETKEKKPGERITMRTTITVSDGDESASGVGFGCGQDTEDKAPMKAQTASYKYALCALFCIGMGDDPEVHDERNEPATKAVARKAPAQPATDPALVEAADLLRAVTTPDEMEAWVGIHYATIKALPEKERKTVWGAVKATAKKAGVAEEGLLAWIAKADAKGGAK